MTPLDEADFKQLQSDLEKADYQLIRKLPLTPVDILQIEARFDDVVIKDSKWLSLTTVAGAYLPRETIRIIVESMLKGMAFSITEAILTKLPKREGADHADRG